MKNKWKWSFFALAAVIVIVIIVIASLIFSGGEKDFDKAEQTGGSLAGKKLFTIHTGKEQAAFLMNKQIEEQKNLDLKVKLTNQMKLFGRVDVFGREVVYQMSMAPEVLPNGDLALHEKNVQVGRLNLPGEQVLNLVSNSVDLPKWVKVYPQEEMIHVQLTKMNIKKHIKVKAKEVDLPHNNISIDVFGK
ncbi:YpmS family protein [Fictibacillus sp. KIGAM418]|uniref:YpmS family protein n=1 Tax=Fictibacillus marinisediminis TaxID=2878389 RepID=A0A9X1X8F8_9BACL|nr:YpmS family protein [Fictibacillus marinisediminis]MCK6255874.1 YpmS family protein [Fictibacillus marinisediminis]